MIFLTFKYFFAKKNYPLQTFGRLLSPPMRSGQTIKWSNDQVKISQNVFGNLQNPSKKGGWFSNK